MPWCPKCKSEYRKDIKRCDQCDIDLVEKLENEEQELNKDNSEELLISLSDSMTADMIEAKLEDSGIPVLKKHKGTGGFLNIYMGSSNLGVDLYVPSKFLEKAKEVIHLELS